jgi:mono/diheme cytochrome c family protein
MKRALATITLALGLALGCGDSAAPPPAATPVAPPPAPAAAPAPAPAPVEPAAPAAAVKPDVAAGAALYATNCATCHGARGAGDGPAAAALDPKPAHHSDGAYMNALSNEHLFKVIKDGGVAVGKSPMMAPWGGMLSDAQIWDLVAFVRSLAEPPYEGTVP